MRRLRYIFLALTACVTFLFVGKTLTSDAQTYSISGRIVLEGRYIDLDVTVWTTPYHMLRTDGWGNYSIEELEGGEYVVRAWSKYCLAQIVDTVHISGEDITDVNDTLVVGDFVEDGRINLYDAGKALRHYGARPDSSNWDEEMDIIRSGVIDSLDITQLMLHWKETSDSPLPPSTIVVTEPDSSAMWYLNQPDVSVSWNTGNLGGAVSIDLYQGMSLVGTISPSTLNDGSYAEYDVPDDLSPGKDYSVRVGYDDNYYDYSECFEIQETIEVTSPNSNSTWELGQQNVPISWTTGNLGGAVSISLYESGSLVGTIAPSTENDGVYTDNDVPIDLTPGREYQVRVSYDEYYFDDSELFVIARPSDWFWLNPLPQGHRLNSVSFTDVHTGAAVGDFGTILRTIDGGATWVSQMSNTRRDLLSVEFTDANTGMAVGTQGTILRTTDGGVTWFGQLSGTSTTLKDVSFTDTNTGTIVGGNVFLRTMNGGYTWEGQVDTYYDLTGVSFADADTGTVVGEYDIGFEVIRRTNNGGASWVTQWESLEYFKTAILDVSFEDAYRGTAVGAVYFLGTGDYGGWVLRTTAGGSTWESQKYPSFPFYGGTYGVSSVQGNIWCVGQFGRIFRGTYKMTTWEQQQSGTVNRLRGVSFTDMSNGTVVGDNGVILRTQNGGATWGEQSIGTSYKSLRDIQFIDASTATAVGDGGTILRTTDGGATWVRQNSGVGFDLQSVSFSDADTGTVVAIGYDLDGDNRAIIIQTTDGGETWVQQWFGTLITSLYGVSCTDGYTGTAVGLKNDYPTGREGLILRTTDGGATWVQQTSGVSITLYDVFFTDTDTGTAVGEDGTIIRTTDGGATWVGQTSGVSETLYDIFFTDANTGTAVGRDGTIIRTTDGGDTWVSQYSRAGNPLYGVSLWDENRGAAVGKNGMILTTIDGGITWIRQSSCTKNGLYGVYVTDENSVTAVGDGGIIIRTTSGLD